MSLLDPFTHAVAAVLAGAHASLRTLGADPDSGTTWVLCLALVVVVVRLCVLPVAAHGVRLAHANARARPHLQELAQRYQGRTDPDALREQMAERRRIGAEHGVSRLGCLPLLLQLPVWIGLYHVVRDAAAGVPTGLLDGALVDSFRSATVAGVSLASTGYLGAGGVHLAVVAGLAGTAALLSYLTQRVFVRQNTAPIVVPEGTGSELAQAMGSTQRLLPLVSAGGLLLAGGVVPVALLVYWVCSQAWTLAFSACVWRWWPTPGTPAHARHVARAA